MLWITSFDWLASRSSIGVSGPAVALCVMAGSLRLIHERRLVRKGGLNPTLLLPTDPQAGRFTALTWSILLTLLGDLF